MLYYFKKGKNATEMQKKMCAVYGEGAVTDWTCQSGLQSFRLDIPHWSMLYSWVEQLSWQRSNRDIENNQRYTMQEIITLLKISKSIKLLVKMKNVFFYGKKNLNELFG